MKKSIADGNIYKDQNQRLKKSIWREPFKTKDVTDEASKGGRAVSKVYQK